MINFPNLIKDYIIYKFNIFLFTMIQMDYDRFKKIEERTVIIKTIDEIKNITKEFNLESNLFKNISSFLYGDFIEVTFINNDFSYYLFKSDVISSETLLKLYYKHESDNKNIFKLNIEYDKRFFKLLINYLIYNDNKDNIGTMIYNSKSWLYLKDSDDFNNRIIFSLNYLELRRFQSYIRYFKVKVLDFKVNCVLDIISICKENSVRIDREPINKFI